MYRQGTWLLWKSQRFQNSHETFQNGIKWWIRRTRWIRKSISLLDFTMAEGGDPRLRPLWLKSKLNDILMLLADLAGIGWRCRIVTICIRKHMYINTYGGKHLSFTWSFGIESKIAPFTNISHSFYNRLFYGGYFKNCIYIEKEKKSVQFSFYLLLFSIACLVSYNFFKCGL